MAVVGYKSLLNPTPIPPQASLRIINEFRFEFYLSDPSAPFHAGDSVNDKLRTFGDDVPIDLAARMERLGNDINSGRTAGPRIIIARFPGQTLVLDKQWLKHTVLLDTALQYSGGLVKLEDVSFVNCVFKMGDTPSAQGIADRVLAEQVVCSTTRNPLPLSHLMTFPHAPKVIGAPSGNSRVVLRLRENALLLRGRRRMPWRPALASHQEQHKV